MTVDYTQPPQPASPSQAPRSWWSRNWKWVVAVGCLTPVILIGGCVAALVLFVTGALRNNEPYQEALRRARAHPEVVSRLGTPIETKWWLTGNINDEDVRLVIPIHGPKGNATLHVRGTRDAGRWTYDRMVVETPDARINLLDETSPPGSTDTAPPGE